MALKRINPFLIFCYAIALLFAIACLLPFIMVISGSLSLESDIITHGYGLYPKNVSLLAYKVLLLDYARIAHAYGVTISVTVIGTAISLLINTMMGYSISRKTLKYKNFLSFYLLITILFSGGIVPWYIVSVNYLHLKDTYFALILPYLANAWYIFLLRNFMKAIPEELHESAKIDGAKELTTFIRIILPLTLPALAAVGLFTALGYWNDWWLGLMLVDDEKLQPLQLLLRTIISNVEFIRTSQNSADISRLYATLPTEGIKMAMSIITIGPIIFLYPFLQKYFLKGILVGAVKG